MIEKRSESDLGLWVLPHWSHRWWWKLTHLGEESHVNWCNETLMKANVKQYPLFDRS